MRFLSVAGLAFVLLLAPGSPRRLSLPDDGPPPRVHPNDNRTPAGRLHGDTLMVQLEVRLATWRPEGDSGPAVEVAAFAEAGRAPEIPAPLIRVPAGSIVVASVQNLLRDSTITVHGLARHPAGQGDTLLLRPGESATVTFLAGEPGTYLYRAVAGHHDPELDVEREQIAGAFIVDPPGGSPPDRVLVINIWGRLLDSVTYQNALTINGLSWPHTERIAATVGDSVRWRVINASWRPHPMHLHGFYFQLEAHGGGLADTLLPPEERPLLATRSLQPWQTMAMTWSPDRIGNWLFHCHIGFHVVADTRMEPPGEGSHDRMAHDPTVHMAGLVMGIAVHPAAGTAEPARGPARRLRLFVQEGRRRGHAPRAMGYVLQRGPRAPAPDSVEIPASPLVLTRDQPTDITVINRLTEPAAIHWHGIELESYSDGVAGWSGFGPHLAPSIQPGDSFVARLVLPRAGTFIYHTHMNDIEQLTSGLYGGLVVLDPGQRWDPRRDHLFVAGWDGDEGTVRLLVNGDSLPPPLELAAGVTHRLRFVNIGPAVQWRFSVYRDTALAEWRRLARDGADLPPALAVQAPAVERIDVGETRDVFLTPSRGDYRLVVGDPATPKWVQLLRVR